MAIVAAPSLNLTYIGVGPSGTAQIIADQTSGPKSKTLYGYGVITNGNTTTGANAAPVGFIDGVQSLGRAIYLRLQSVTAPATINGTANQAIYSSVYGVDQIQVNDSVVIAGFTNSGNNGTFTVNAKTDTGIQVTNSSSVAETNNAATLSDLFGGTPIWVSVFPSGNSADTAAVIVAGGALLANNVTNTGFTINWSAWATTAQTEHFGCVIAFSN